MLSLHAHTETFPVRIAPVPVRSYATRVIHVVLWMCFPSKDSLQPARLGKHLSIRRLTRCLTATSNCLPIRPLLGPPAL